MSANGAPRFREDLLEAFSNAAGVSGGERAVRELVAGAVMDRVDALEIDAMGSLVARVDPATSGAGAKRAGARRVRGPHVMLCAHLDEVGLMITAI